MKKGLLTYIPQDHKLHQKIEKKKNKKKTRKNYTPRSTQTQFRNYDTYHEPLSKELINRRSRNHLAYTIVPSAVKLHSKSQHPILWVGLIN